MGDLLISIIFLFYNEPDFLFPICERVVIFFSNIHWFELIIKLRGEILKERGVEK